jgi:hypothetical protein
MHLKYLITPQSNLIVEDLSKKWPKICQDSIHLHQLIWIRGSNKNKKADIAVNVDKEEDGGNYTMGIHVNSATSRTSCQFLNNCMQ